MTKKNINKQYRHRCPFSFVQNEMRTQCIMSAGLITLINLFVVLAIVGGSIDHFTRNMTATIALETSKGNVSLGIVLGTILISLTLLISISLNFLNKNNDQSQ